MQVDTSYRGSGQTSADAPIASPDDVIAAAFLNARHATVGAWSGSAASIRATLA